MAALGRSRRDLSIEASLRLWTLALSRISPINSSIDIIVNSIPDREFVQRGLLSCVLWWYARYVCTVPT